MAKPDWWDPRAIDDAERAGAFDPPHPSEYMEDPDMGIVNVTAGTNLPGASEKFSPAISYGEGATDALLNSLRGMTGWTVEVTDEYGSYAARLDEVTTDDRHIYAILVTRMEWDDDGNEVILDQRLDQRLVPLDKLRRVHVW